MTKKPVTITIDTKLDEKIRRMQASIISSTGASWSYSEILCLVAEEGIKKFKVGDIINKH